MNYMLAGVDKVTGESLSDENIRYQINTFLIAGHETTSGLMSFTLYYLLNNPDILERAYEEVDRVLGRDISATPTIKQVNQLTYINQILSEALRLWPTAPALGIAPYEDEIVGGKYKLKKGTFVTVLSLMLHRDKSVWGENADAFDPENFSREALADRPVHAYKPFGNGQRACIGRQFAMQEANLVIGMILQRFQLFDHTNYQLKIKESLSIKPDGFFIKAKLRPDVTRSRMVPGAAVEEESGGLSQAAKIPSHGTKALVLYGSNLGTTEEFARQIARSADQNGFDTELGTMDAFAGKLPKDGAVILACASYNGTPPDNAGAFVEALANAAPGSLDGVRYALFGCGHSDWAATFQATPRIIDDALQAAGATRIGERGEGDAKDDIDEAFDGWFAELWPTVGTALDLDVTFDAAAESEPLYKVEFIDAATDNPLVAQLGAKAVTVRENRELQSGSDRSTRHIEVSLAPGQTYNVGDHLSVVPRNAPDLVRRVEQRFSLPAGGHIRLQSTSSDHSALPTQAPMPLRTLLEDLIELQAPASRKDVAALARHTECPKSRPELDRLAGDGFKADVQGKKLSSLDLLERFPACEMPFAAFLETCPNMVPRYYSISSSPLANAENCTITVAVVDSEKADGGHHKGVCSSYLAGENAGETLFASLRQPSAGFTLPDDLEQPIIMIGPGTGLAPFRGFCQERAALKADGKTLGPAMLFFGCRHPEQDFLYEEELQGWAKDGVMELHTAFSRAQKRRVYVQDVIRDQRDAVWALIDKGAKIFVCGDGGRMEPDVRRALTTIYAEETDSDDAAAEAWFTGLMRDGRYVLDVWVSD